MSQPGAAPQATGNAPVVPQQAAPAQQPAQPIVPAPPAQGAAHPAPAPAPTRNRNPRGPIPAPVQTAGPGVPALLEIGAANPFSTEFLRSQNYYVPTAIHLFHVLGICDNAMSTTYRFLQSAPLWLPIVSHYYISILWLCMILRVRMESGYATGDEITFIDQMIRFLHIDNCLVPGPLVPFFSALAASSSAYEWLGDVLPGLPTVAEMLMNSHGHINHNWLRSVPFPAAILDQLHHWVFWTVPANQSRYGNFEWYRSVFGGDNNASAAFRLGPQASGSLYVTENQHTTAHTSWLAVLGPNATSVYTRQTLENSTVFDNFFEFSGFVDARAQRRTIIDIFIHVSQTMQSYCMYFNGSIALKAIAPMGLGSGIPRGIPTTHVDIRNWLYPAVFPNATLAGRMAAIHPIPRNFGARFEHADPDLEEVAEQYAITTHVNIDLGHANNAIQNGFDAPTYMYAGSMWQMLHFRRTGIVSVHNAYGMTIAARYHQSTALRPT